MATGEERDPRRDREDGPRHRVRLPGFLVEEEIGLGAAIARATTYLGIRPCGGCKRRAAALDRWLAFTPRRR